MYVCMHSCMYVCMYVRMYVCMVSVLCVSVFLCSNAVCMHACACTYECEHVHAHTCTHARTSVHACVRSKSFAQPMCVLCRLHACGMRKRHNFHSNESQIHRSTTPLLSSRCVPDCHDAVDHAVIVAAIHESFSRVVEYYRWQRGSSFQAQAQKDVNQCDSFAAESCGHPAHWLGRNQVIINIILIKFSVRGF
jgi:hypothetical protein